MENKKVLLSVEDLQVKFRVRGRQLTAIRGISLDIYENESIAIVGESGSGKTTLMNVVGGLDDFHSGSLEIDDFKIKKYSSKTIDRVRNEKVGYIFQNYLLRVLILIDLIFVLK